MTVYLALNQCTYDLFKPESGGVTRVKDGRFVVQQVQSKLRTVFGEWILNRSIGFLSRDDFIKNFDRYELESKVVEIVLGTQGVKSIIDINLTFKDRKLTIDFQAETIYGTIDTAVPWGCDGKVVETVPEVARTLVHQGVQVTFGGVDLFHTSGG